MQKHNKYFAEDAFNSSNRQLEIYYIRTNQPTTGQSRTPLEKPRYFNPFGQAGLSPLATI